MHLDYSKDLNSDLEKLSAIFFSWGSTGKDIAWWAYKLKNHANFTRIAYNLDSGELQMSVF